MTFGIRASEFDGGESRLDHFRDIAWATSAPGYSEAVTCHVDSTIQDPTGDIFTALGAGGTGSTVTVAGDITATLPSPEEEDVYYFLIPPAGVDWTTGTLDLTPPGRTSRYLAFQYLYIPPVVGVWIEDEVVGAQTGTNLSGMHYAWNRFYQPETGRWLTPDPAASPWANLFAAHGQSGLAHSDPTGLSIVDKLKCLTEREKSILRALIAAGWTIQNGNVSGSSAGNTYRKQDDQWEIDYKNKTITLDYFWAETGCIQAGIVIGFVGRDLGSNEGGKNFRDVHGKDDDTFDVAKTIRNAGRGVSTIVKTDDCPHWDMNCVYKTDALLGSASMGMQHVQNVACQACKIYSTPSIGNAATAAAIAASCSECLASPLMQLAIERYKKAGCCKR